MTGETMFRMIGKRIGGQFTDRERQIIAVMAQGQANKEDWD